MPTYVNNYCICIIIDSINSTKLNKDIVSSKDLPLIPNNFSGDKVPHLSNSLVENVSSIEFCEYLEPEFQRLLENNFEGIEYYYIDNNINKSIDSNQNLEEYGLQRIINQEKDIEVSDESNEVYEPRTGDDCRELLVYDKKNDNKSLRSKSERLTFVSSSENVRIL
ncbi:Hypothetical protein CINCED_3A009219 [Cinara cedri]|uniref:Uncharacterized protein n=1 Tax=Cinara cedri TaxID=506608 RepID=A0A5E4MEI6_9HEMI|nr:Hypothetical protein CINCED_3A009219 [Cinara cedri]